MSVIMKISMSTKMESANKNGVLAALLALTIRAMAGATTVMIPAQCAKTIPKRASSASTIVTKSRDLNAHATTPILVPTALVHQTARRANT